MLWTDLGLPKTARKTRRLIKDLEMLLHLSRVHRPTDNARQERLSRTGKERRI